MYLLLILLLNFHQLCFARQHEPSCSQFDFQEKLLENTVRYEHKLDVFYEKFEEWETRMSANLNDLTAIKHELRQKLEDVDITLEEKKTEFDVALEEGFKKQELTLNTIKEKALTPTTVFLVKGVSDQDVDAGKVIKFTTVVTNEGGAYDLDTGKFTAPYNGSYIFSTSVCVQNGNWLIVKLMAEDKEIGSAARLSMYSGTCSGISGMAVLSKGDMVCVQGAYSNTKGLHNGASSHNPSVPTFSGMLVHTGTALQRR